MTRRHNLEKKQLPKIQKQEYRAALTEFRKTLRHSIMSTGKGRDKEEEKDRLKQVSHREALGKGKGCSKALGFAVRGAANAEDERGSAENGNEPRDGDAGGENGGAGLDG